MVSSQIKFVVLGHPRRRDQAVWLATRLDAHLLMDYASRGANWGHHQAMVWAAEQGVRVVVLEDDALPVDGFEAMVESWLDRFPDSLVSFYLGTGRPPQYQLKVAEKLIESDKTHSDYITLPRLIHGVCYSVPQAHVSNVLKRWDSHKAADYAVGDAWGGVVVYPCWSLVEHQDGPSVERPWNNSLRRERRQAWRLHRGEPAASE